MMHGMHGQGGGYDKAYITCLLYVSCLGDQQGPTDRMQHIKKPSNHTPCLHIQTKLSLLPSIAFLSVPLPTSDRNVHVKYQLAAGWQVCSEQPVPLAAKLTNPGSYRGQG